MSLKTFSFDFKYQTKPLFRKGREARETIAFAAQDLTEAYWLARQEAEQRYRRRKWQIVKCKEILTGE